MKCAKIVLVGAVHAGKTSIISRYISDRFTDCTQSTTQPGFYQRVVAVEKRRIQLEIWDTAGQERYHALSPLLFRDSRVGIVVFDITDMETFERATRWIGELRSSRGDEVLIVLIGNKSDLADERSVVRADAENLAASHGIQYFEVSAKLNTGISELFAWIARSVAESLPLRAVEEDVEPHKSLKTTVTIQDDKSGGRC